MVHHALVIAHYEENLAWLSEVGPGWAVRVYSKGRVPSPGAVPLPNVGREAHTYLTHIVDQWEHLAPVTVFAQGDPFDHCPDFLAQLKLLEAGESVTFTPLGDLEIIFDRQGFPHLSEEPATRAGLYLDQFYREICGGELPPLLHCRANAIFAVSAGEIRARPREFYARGIEALARENNPIAGHYFERLWGLLFAGPMAGTVRGVNSIPVLWSTPHGYERAEELMEAWRGASARGDHRHAVGLLIALNHLVNAQRPAYGALKLSSPGGPPHFRM